jgi:hypothetical protein
VGIAAWAANVPTGAPPAQTFTPSSYSSSQPKLLRPQSSRPVPPALSMSESSSTSTPLATPPPSHKLSVLSSLANHVKSFVSSSSAGFPITQSRIKRNNRLDYRMIHPLHSSSPSSASFAEDEHDSPTNSSFEDTEDLWWVTESDCSSTLSKKSSAQSIVTGSRQHEFACFQPGVLPVELFSRISRAAEPDEEDSSHAWRSRGRQISRTVEEDC